MKRFLIIILALLLLLSMVACGGGSSPAPSAPASTAEEESEGDTPEETAQAAGNSGGGSAIDSLVGWMKGGKFSYDYKAFSEGAGEKMESSGTMAVDGDNFAMSSEAEVAGVKIKSKIVTKDGFTYIVNDEAKMIMKFQDISADMTGGVMDDYSGIVLIGSGTGEINGRTLPYEEYKEDESGSTIKYFLDGGQVYGFVSEYENYKTTMIITNAKNSVPSGIFDLPSGYTEMSL